MALDYKGVNLAGLEFGTGKRVNIDYVLPGKAHYDYWAQDVGSNVVRLPFMWERLQPQLGGSLDQEYLSYLKSSVTWAKQNGMTIALDLHNYARYNGNVVNASQLTDVWKKIHAVFGDDSSVWFNLMNEPYNVSANSWADLTQQVVNNLRASGVDNKLLLSGTAWSGAHSWVSSGNAAAYDDFVDPLNNYAFDVHQYLDRDSSGFTAEAIKGAGSTRLIAVTQWAEAGGHKLFLGETGLANTQASHDEMSAMIKYMESHEKAWLGFTLWGAGPWWGSNYVFYINPSNLGGNEVHAPSIAGMLPLLIPDDTPAIPGPSPQPQPEPIDHLFNLTSRVDTVNGTKEDDTVATWMGQLSGEDKVALGTGHDTLMIQNTGLTLNTADLRNFSGVDEIDITKSLGKANIYLSEEFIGQSDNKSVTVSYGNAGYGSIAMVTDTPELYRIEHGTNKVTVTYQPPQTPGPTPIPNPTPTPGITVKATSRSETIEGTSGDDLVQAYSGQLNSGDVFKMGAGVDTVKMLSGSFDFNGGQFSGWSGVDRLDMSGTKKGNDIILNRAIIDQSDNDSFTILFGNATLGSLDTSALAKGSYTVNWTATSVTVSLLQSSTLSSGTTAARTLMASDVLDSIPDMDDTPDLYDLFEANGLDRTSLAATMDASGMAASSTAVSAEQQFGVGLDRLDNADDLAAMASSSVLTI